MVSGCGYDSSWNDRCCVEIIDIVYDQATWDSGTVTCLSNFDDGDSNPHTGAGTYANNDGLEIDYTNLKLLATGGDPVTVVETNCNSCVTNVLDVRTQ